MARVLAAVDGSAVAPAVLLTASSLAELLGGRVEALHVGPEVPAALALIAAESGMPVRSVDGDEAATICAELARPDVVLGVLGASGETARTGPAGHTALAVVQEAGRPVVVVPPLATGPTAGAVGRVLAPLDGSEASAHAVEESIRMFCARGTDVVVLHVFDPTTVPRFWDQAVHAQPVWEEEFRARFCDQPGVRVRLRSGVPGELVVDVAAEEKVDLIVLGWAQDLSPGRARTVRETLGAAPVPILLVPRDGRLRPAGGAGAEAEAGAEIATGGEPR